MAAGRIPTTANSPLTAKGDLFGYSTAPARLAVGSNGETLVADSVAATGLAYKTKGVFNGLTTTGDTIYSSSGTTQSRLGIGSTGQVLTVASGVPSWATPSSGSLTLSQIATGTLSGTSVTISSLSSYDRILLKVTGMNPSSNTTPNIRINNNSGANYQRLMIGQSASTTGGDYQSSLTEYYIGGTTGEAQGGNTTNGYWVYFENCKSAGFTNVQHFCFYTNVSNKENGISSGIYTVAEAVSSLVFRANGVITFSAGAYTVWGG